MTWQLNAGMCVLLSEGALGQFKGRKLRTCFYVLISTTHLFQMHKVFDVLLNGKDHF